MIESPFPISKGARNQSRRETQHKLNRARRMEQAHVVQGKEPWKTYNRGAYTDNGILQSFIIYGVIKRSDLDLFFQQDKRNLIEIGGPANTLVRELQELYPDNIGQTAGVTLIDHHLSQLPHHTVIEGDLTLPIGEEGSTYDKIVNLMGKNNVDLIVSRMVAGLTYLPKDPYILTQLITDMYEHILSLNGIMLLQIPETVLPFMPEWMTVLASAEGIQARFTYTQGFIGGYVMLKRNTQSPTRLPLLALDALRRVYAKLGDGSWVEDVRKFTFSP